MNPRTGAQHGRAGGKLSGGARCARALQQAPKVKAIAVVPAATAKRKADEPSIAPQRLCTEALSHSATAAANAIAAAAGVSPEIAQLIQAGALAAIAASQHLPAASASSASAASLPLRLPAPSPQQAPVITPAKPATGFTSGTSQPSSTSLTGHTRGTLVLVKPKAQYGSRRLFDFTDICKLGEKIRVGMVAESDLRKTNADGTPLLVIPRTTMRRWLLDDDEARKQHGQRGLPGQPHWLVERDVRGRTETDKPGPGTVMGVMGEKKLMLELSNAAAKGWAYMEDEVDDLVRNISTATEIF